jgi:hypothetical protein
MEGMKTSMIDPSFIHTSSNQIDTVSEGALQLHMFHTSVPIKVFLS